MKHFTDQAVRIGRWSIQPRMLYAVVFLAWDLYLLLTLSAPATSANQFHIAPVVLVFLKLTIALPYLVIWLSATYSFICVKNYAFSIHPSPEWRAFTDLSHGVAILLLSLIFSTIAGSLRPHFALHEFWHPMFTIITNYTYVFPYLVAFYFFYHSARSLAPLAHADKQSPWRSLVYAVPFIVFVYFWLETIFTNTARMTTHSMTLEATYYLKDSLLILTIIIPSLLSWALGLQTYLLLSQYYQHVKGLLYKRALSSFVYGLASVILGSIVLQAVLSVGSTRLYHLGLGGLLLIIYIFLVIQTIGYMLLAHGAQNLSRIEAA
jgi:hypothetical protein